MCRDAILEQTRLFLQFLDETNVDLVRFSHTQQWWPETNYDKQISVPHLDLFFSGRSPQARIILKPPPMHLDLTLISPSRNRTIRPEVARMEARNRANCTRGAFPGRRGSRWRKAPRSRCNALARWNFRASTSRNYFHVSIVTWWMRTRIERTSTPP
jgi:hypothetical protein